MDNLTVRELRNLLYEVKDQGMTVEQLRRMLFEIDNQDGPAIDAIR